MLRAGGFGGSGRAAQRGHRRLDRGGRGGGGRGGGRASPAGQPLLADGALGASEARADGGRATSSALPDDETAAVAAPSGGTHILAGLVEQILGGMTEPVRSAVIQVA